MSSDERPTHLPRLPPTPEDVEEEELEANLVQQQLQSSASWKKNVHALSGFRSPLAAAGHASPLAIGSGRQRAAQRAASSARQTENFARTSRALGGVPEEGSAADASGAGSSAVAAESAHDDSEDSDDADGDDAAVAAALNDSIASSVTELETAAAPGGAAAPDAAAPPDGSSASAAAGAPGVSPRPPAASIVRAASELHKWEALLARREEALAARENALASSNARQRLVLQLRAQVEQRERVAAELQERLSTTLASVDSAIHDAVAEERRKLLGMVDSASAALAVLQGELVERERAVEAGERVLAERLAAADASILKRVTAADEGIRLRHAQTAKAIAERTAAVEAELAARVERVEVELAARIAAAEAREADAGSFDRQARADLEAQRAMLEEREAAFAARVAEARARGLVPSGAAAAGTPGSARSADGGDPSAPFQQQRSFLLTHGGTVAAAAAAAAVAALAPPPPPGGTQMEALARRFGGGSPAGVPSPPPASSPAFFLAAHALPVPPLPPALPAPADTVAAAPPVVVRDPPFRMAGPTGYASAHPYSALMSRPSVAPAAPMPPSPPTPSLSGDIALPLLFSPPPGFSRTAATASADAFARRGTATVGTPAPLAAGSAVALPFGVAALLSDPGSVRETRSPLARTETWSSAPGVKRPESITGGGYYS